MSLDTSKLQCIKRGPDNTLTAACPVCRAAGSDRKGDHLKVWLNTNTFNCIVGSSEPGHNSQIRAILRGYLGSDEQVEVVYIEPKLDVETVYPESVLSKLLLDFAYWTGRGAKESVVSAFGGGLAPEEERSKLSGRFVFPCRNIESQLIGFAGRLIKESSYAPKWKILGSKKNFMFPHWTISGPIIKEKSQAILVEGIGCVIALAQVDVWNTICLFGLDISSQQLSSLIAVGVDHVVIATNNEASGVGNKAAQKLKRKLDNFFTRVDIHLPYSKDFMEMDELALRRWISEI